jgi:hypothetical protein
MGLVDSEKIDFCAPEQPDHVAHQQPFGSDIEKAQRAVAYGFGDALALAGVGSRIQRRRRHAEFAQLRDLIAHQRDQRRNHQRQPLARHRR